MDQWFAIYFVSNVANCNVLFIFSQKQKHIFCVKKNQKIKWELICTFHLQIKIGSRITCPRILGGEMYAAVVSLLAVVLPVEGVLPAHPSTVSRQPLSSTAPQPLSFSGSQTKGTFETQHHRCYMLIIFPLTFLIVRQRHASPHLCCWTHP